MIEETTFGERLKKALSEKDMSQKRLAELIGFSEITIGRFVHNKFSPTLRTARNVAEAVGCDYIWLLTGETIDYFADIKGHSVIETNVRYSRIIEQLEEIKTVLTVISHRELSQERIVYKEGYQRLKAIEEKLIVLMNNKFELEDPELDNVKPESPRSQKCRTGFFRTLWLKAGRYGKLGYEENKR